MYVDFGRSDDSETLFGETAIRDVVSWNTMIFIFFRRKHYENGRLFEYNEG